MAVVAVELTRVRSAARDARRHARASLAAVAVLIALSVNLGATGSAQVARAGLAFQEVPLPDPPSVGRPATIRRVNPSLQRIDAWISAVGAGIALSDLDANGRDDDACHVDPRFDTVTVEPVPSTGARYPRTLLRPDPLPYDATTMAPMGCLPIDTDEDGRMDLIVYYWGRTPVVFRRTSDGTYQPRELTRSALWNTNAMTAADVDGDGHADLVVGNYFADGDRVLDTRAPQRVSMQSSMSRATNGGTSRVLLWTAGGRYREALDAIPAAANHGWTLAVGAQDLDGDLLPELYFANDFGNDRLLANASSPGHVRLRLVEGRKGIADPSSKLLGRDSFKGMGVDFGDLNGDDRPDIFVSNIAERFALMESNFVWTSASASGPLEYRDRSEPLGLARSGWGWDTRLDDLDNDGDLDALQATGFVRGDVNRWPELQELAIGNDAMLSNADHWPNFGPGADISGRGRVAVYRRGTDRRFHDVTPAAGPARVSVSRGVATADVNGDGLLDFAVANQWQRSYVYLNRCAPRCGASLELRLLRSDPAGRHATPSIGAQASVRLGGDRRVTRQVDGGNGHSGKRTTALWFGLGQRRAPVRVDIRWRDVHAHVRSQTAVLAPGSHTILLRDPGATR